MADYPGVFKDVSTQPNNTTSYRQMASAAEEWIEKTCTVALQGKSLKFRGGNCTIVGDGHGRETRPLWSEDDWKEMCTVLLNISSQYRQLHLHIKREYFSLLTMRASEETLASAKATEMLDLMQTSFDGSTYIPSTDLLRVVSKEMIHQIIIEDDTLKLRPGEKEEFIIRVQQQAPVLLAVCVYARMRMGCLKKLLDSGCCDESLPLTRSEFCHVSCRHDFITGFLTHQSCFRAAQFLRKGEHQTFAPTTAVPIHYYPRDDLLKENKHQFHDAQSEPNIELENVEKDVEEKQRAYCGSGAYSKVYRVRINPAHHRLSKVSD